MEPIDDGTGGSSRGVCEAVLEDEKSPEGHERKDTCMSVM